MTSVILQSAAAGELLAAEIRVSPRFLEDLLEALAGASFPINPELEHLPRGRSSVIRFPVYQSQVHALRDLLMAAGFSHHTLRMNSMAGQISGAAEDEESSYEATL